MGKITEADIWTHDKTMGDENLDLRMKCGSSWPLISTGVGCPEY